MAKHLIKNRSITLNIATDDDLWTIVKGKTISVTGDFSALDIAAGAPGNNIIVNGSLLAESPLSKAINDLGMGSSIVVGATGLVSGGYGIYAAGQDTGILNYGKIRGQNVGIFGAEDDLTVVNAGRISGFEAIEFTGHGSQLVNRSAGVIKATETAVSLSGAGDLTLINKGLISAGEKAFDAQGTGTVSIDNYGKIVGDVQLGAGADLFNNRYGILLGDVYGGAGNDVAYVNSYSTNFIEYANEGFDTVRASVDYKLGENVEKLVLLGDENSTGDGSIGDNILIGNRGGNLLSGYKGNDILNGRGGNDVLIGDVGADIFAFSPNGDVDLIIDFSTKENDKIDITAFTAIADYSQIKAAMIQSDRDVILRFGNGDRLFIGNTTIQELSADDFLF